MQAAGRPEVGRPGRAGPTTPDQSACSTLATAVALPTPGGSLSRHRDMRAVWPTLHRSPGRAAVEAPRCRPRVVPTIVGRGVPARSARPPLSARRPGRAFTCRDRLADPKEVERRPPSGALRAIDSTACLWSWRTCRAFCLRPQSQPTLVARQSGLSAPPFAGQLPGGDPGGSTLNGSPGTGA